MRNKIFISILAVILLFAAGLAYSQYQTKVYMKQGGDEQVVASGGQVTVESGGTIDVESGGNFKIAGVAVTVSAVEQNYLDGSTVGAAVASKAVVLDASKRFIGGVAYVDTSFADGDTLTTADYGKIIAIYNTTKKTLVLPLAASGGNFSFIVDDTDSLVIDANASDKIIDGSDEYEKETTVAGTVNIVAVDGTNWYMMGATGTWTGY